MIDVNLNLIAEFHTNYERLQDIMPYKQYNAGARDDDKPVHKDMKDSSSNPILTLEFDILNEYGYGLKKGYYEIAVSSEYDCLMFVQSNEIKAKIPIVKQELISSYGTNFEWEDKRGNLAPNTGSKNLTDEVQISSKKILRQTFDEKELKKRQKKYKKGQDPITYFHSKAWIEYDKTTEAYKIIWEKYNTRIIGIMKIK